MVISHKYRYLFIEVPLTGSWAIRNELCEFYGGQQILHKHATYHEFQQSATDDERAYFVFATVRNPLDSMVSAFYKYKSDHKGVFSDAQHSINTNIIDYADVMIFDNIQGSDITFESTVLSPKIWHRPYSSMIDVCAEHVDFVLRFEKLGEDFSSVLNQLEIEQVRPLPVSNKTKGRKGEWATYYSEPMIPRVMRDCGPFMQRWGYEFPAAWGDASVTPIKRLEYSLTILMKKIYLTQFRYSDSMTAKIARKANAMLKRRVYS